MATFSIEITDEQAERSLAAFGHWEVIGADDFKKLPAARRRHARALPTTMADQHQVWVNATPEEAVAGVTDLLKDYVVSYEANKAHQDAASSGEAEAWGSTPAP